MSLTPLAPPTTTVRFTGPASCLATTKLHILSGDCLLEQRLAWSSAFPTVTTCSYLVHGPLTSYEGECTQPNPTDASQTLYTSCPAGYTGACTGYFTPEDRPWRVNYHVTCCPDAFDYQCGGPMQAEPTGKPTSPTWRPYKPCRALSASLPPTVTAALGTGPSPLSSGVMAWGPARDVLFADGQLAVGYVYLDGSGASVSTCDGWYCPDASAPLSAVPSRTGAPGEGGSSAGKATTTTLSSGGMRTGTGALPTSASKGAAAGCLVWSRGLTVAVVGVGMLSLLL